MRCTCAQIVVKSKLTNGCVVGVYTPFVFGWRRCPRALSFILDTLSIYVYQHSIQIDRIIYLLVPFGYSLRHWLNTEITAKLWFNTMKFLIEIIFCTSFHTIYSALFLVFVTILIKYQMHTHTAHFKSIDLCENLINFNWIYEQTCTN